MDLQLRDRVALVGGASQGIGFGIARRLAAEGARVAMFARHEAPLVAAAERITAETGARAVPLVADIRRSDDIARVVAEAVKAFGTVHIVVNNDGAPPVGRLAEFDDTAWQKAVEQNLMSVVRMVRAVIPHMRAAGGGSILNITALSAVQPMIGFGLSVATWAGVIGLAKTLSLELARDRITINTICPGLIDTQRLSKVFTKLAEQEGRDPRLVIDEVVHSVPIGRLGTPDDIASLVALLVSPLGSFITGTVIPVDGGARQSLL
jgi:3-oxoacyl-[acyl-carrier protein] reductase